MRVFAITFGDGQTPSSRYRVIQYQNLFGAAGDDFVYRPRRQLRFGDLFKRNRFDVVLNQKCLLPRFFGLLLRACSWRLIFDLDDAIWTRPGKPYGFFTQWRIDRRLRWWLTHSDLVVCANQYLADYARRFSKNVAIVPMSLDLEHWKRKVIPSGKDISLGWVGAPGNLPYLQLCAPALKIFMQRYPYITLKILCGQRPALDLPFEYIPWSEGAESQFLEGVNIGLLPLPEADAFTLGKSPIKALQYMSFGIPVVGNMTQGGAAEIAKKGGCVVVNSPGEWMMALESLLNPQTYKQLSLEALRNVHENHDMGRVFEIWHQLLCG